MGNKVEITVGEISRETQKLEVKIAEDN